MIIQLSSTRAKMLIAVKIGHWFNEREWKRGKERIFFLNQTRIKWKVQKSINKMMVVVSLGRWSTCLEGEKISQNWLNIHMYSPFSVTMYTVYINTHHGYIHPDQVLSLQGIHCTLFLVNHVCRHIYQSFVHNHFELSHSCCMSMLSKE